MNLPIGWLQFLRKRKGQNDDSRESHRKVPVWSWFWMILGILYFFLPLLATFIFSLKAKLGVLSFKAYENIFNDPAFVYNFSYSVLWALLTIVVGILLFVPTAFLIRLKLQKFRGAVEFITLLPFVVPAIVFVFGLVRTFSHPPLLIVNSPALLIAGYMVLSMPYMYRAVDTGLRSIDVKTLAEAGQSLGASWGSILFDIILPNIRVAILSGAFLSFAIVIGELILAQYLAKPAFAPYMAYQIQQKAYEPAAMAIISFALTWAALGIISLVGRGSGQAQVGGGH
jgi:putative spermidine/putrescine transport system permease protein